MNKNNCSVFKASLLILAVTVLAACTGQRVIRGHEPQVELHALSRDGQALALDINLRNINDQALTLTGMELKLELNQALLMQIEQPLNLTVAARGRERVRIEMVGALAGLEALDALAAGEVDSQRWRMEGRLFSERGNALSVSTGGHLYRVPGRPGQFR